MNRIVATNILRFIGILLLQGLVLKRVTVGLEAFPYLNIILYPIFILLLPLRTPRPLVLILAFLLGFGVDIFYNSPGVHASASLLTALLRPYILKPLEPRGGYTAIHAPNKEKMGWKWFLQYTAVLLGIHLLWYFSMEAFSHVYFFQILLKTFFSFAISIIFIVIFMQIFNPKE